METTPDILLSAFVAVESAHAYSAFLPSIFTIRTFGGQPGTEQAIHDGELVGTIFAVALGLIVTGITRKPLPLVFAIVTAVFMVSIYEWSLQTIPGGSSGTQETNQTRR